MKLDPFEREMIRQTLHQKPSMTLKGISISIALILTFIYVAIDCGIF